MSDADAATYAPLTLGAVSALLMALQSRNRVFQLIDIAVDNMPMLCRIFVREFDDDGEIVLGRPEFLGLDSKFDFASCVITRQSWSWRVRPGVACTDPLPPGYATMFDIDYDDRICDRGFNIMLSLAYPVYDACLNAAKTMGLRMRIGDLWGWGVPCASAHRACVEPSFFHEDLENDQAKQYIKTVDFTRQELTHRIRVRLW